MWIVNWLSGRVLKAEIGGANSSWGPVGSNIPVRSVLDLVLFNISSYQDCFKIKENVSSCFP